MGLLADYLPSFLPQDPNQNQAARQGLLQFGAALLGGRGNFGSILGQGIQAGAGGYNSAMQALQQKALMDAQTQHLGLENQAAQADMTAQQGISKALGAPAPVASAPAVPLVSSAGLSAPISSLPQVGAAPTSDAVPAAPAAPQTAPAAATDAYQQAVSDYMKVKPFGMKYAKPYLDAIKELRPDVKEVKTVTLPDGSRALANIFADGRPPQVLSGVAPDKEKLVGYGAGGTYNFADPFSGKTVASAPITQSPDNAATLAEDRRWHNMQHADNTAGDQAPITPEAIVNAAARYNLDGTLPPMGMGKNAAAGRSAILNKAAELAAGIDPTEQRAMQLAYKGDVKAKTAAIQAFTSGKLGNTVRSFNVLQSHLDTFSKMADALDNGDLQMVNKIGNAIAAQTGKAAPTNFEAIKHIVGDEIVKAVTGSAGALGDREAAAKTIASINSPAQLKGVIESYRELANGQLQGLRQQYQTSTGRTDFDKFLSPNAKASVAPASALPKKTTPPADIAGLLNKYGNR